MFMYRILKMPGKVNLPTFTVLWCSVLLQGGCSDWLVVVIFRDSICTRRFFLLMAKKLGSDADGFVTAYKLLNSQPLNFLICKMELLELMKGTEEIIHVNYKEF